MGYAITGGFVDVGESVEEATKREVLEETNLEVTTLEQFHMYSDPTRDKRRHTVSMVFRLVDRIFIINICACKCNYIINIIIISFYFCVLSHIDIKIYKNIQYIYIIVFILLYALVDALLRISHQ